MIMMENSPEPKKEYLKRIVRAIPVGFGGYIIGKKGCFKSQINTEFGAELRLFNDPLNALQQIIFIDCPEDQLKQVEQRIDEKISEINKKINTNTINTITSNPDQLKPRVELGKLIPGFVMNMSQQTGNDLILILDNNKNLNVKYEQMQQSINREYGGGAAGTNANPPRIPFPIGSGCICIALGSRGKFYRALVISYYYDLAHVYFVDIGKIELLPYNRLFKIKVKYLELPFRAVPVKWNNCQLVSSDQSLPGSIDEVIYRRFLCSRIDSKPTRVYFYFTHVDCCLPFVSIYIAKPSISNSDVPNIIPSNGGGGDDDDEFVDLLELLTTVGLARTIPSEVVLSHNCRRIVANGNCQQSRSATSAEAALFYKPCNFSYYEPMMSIKSSSASPLATANQQLTNDNRTN